MTSQVSSMITNVESDDLQNSIYLTENAVAEDIEFPSHGPNIARSEAIKRQRVEVSILPFYFIWS